MAYGRGGPKVSRLGFGAMRLPTRKKGDWNRVSFKGGSDFGVFNLTTGVETAEGVRHCVSATWNDDETLDEDTFMVLYAGLLHQLK